MLARLWHHRFIGRDDEDDEIDAADAGEHVLDEPLMAGNVDERDVDVADHRVREAEIDRDAAGLLFLQAIGIGPGERLLERALPVVDVAGRTDDDGFHRKRKITMEDTEGIRHRATEAPRRIPAFDAVACEAGHELGHANRGRATQRIHRVVRPRFVVPEPPLRGAASNACVALCLCGKTFFFASSCLRG